MKRLTENHPLVKKLDKIFAIMEEEGVTFDPSGVIFVHHDGKTYRLQDREEANDMLSPSVPPVFEWKLTCE